MKALLAKKLITEAQADAFIKTGAIGSHLENLQRKGGFKGFNQKSVSVISLKQRTRELCRTSFRPVNANQMLNPRLRSRTSPQKSRKSRIDELIAG